MYKLNQPLDDPGKKLSLEEINPKKYHEFLPLFSEVVIIKNNLTLEESNEAESVDESDEEIQLQVEKLLSDDQRLA